MLCTSLVAWEAVRPLAHEIKAPTLVVCGEQEMLAFLDAARWLGANIRGARNAWLAPYRKFWSGKLDALVDHLMQES